MQSLSKLVNVMYSIFLCIFFSATIHLKPIHAVDGVDVCVWTRDRMKNSKIGLCFTRFLSVRNCCFFCV